MNENNKPISMIIKETKAKIANICNESNLSLVILDLIMSELYSEVHSLAEKQTAEEERVYMAWVQNNNMDDIEK